MQKIYMKVYLKGKRFPLFVCEIPDDSEGVLAEFRARLNDERSKVVEFGQACFSRDQFSHYLIEYKK